MPERRIYKKIFNNSFSDIVFLTRNNLDEEICSGKDLLFGDIFGFYLEEFVVSMKVDTLDKYSIYMVSSGVHDKFIYEHVQSGHIN